MPFAFRFGLIALLAASCAGVNVGPGGNSRDGSVDVPVGTGGGHAGGGGGGTSGSPGNDARPQIIIDAGGEGGGGCNAGVTCSPPGGRYCGVIGNGCFGTMDCGACLAGEICEGGLCVGGASCMPLVCQVATGKYCGTVR